MHRRRLSLAGLLLALAVLATACGQKPGVHVQLGGAPAGSTGAVDTELAVGADLDGDGLPDAAAVDADGDGFPDLAPVDPAFVDPALGGLPADSGAATDPAFPADAAVSSDGSIVGATPGGSPTGGSTSGGSTSGGSTSGGSTSGGSTSGGSTSGGSTTGGSTTGGSSGAPAGGSTPGSGGSAATPAATPAPGTTPPAGSAPPATPAPPPPAATPAPAPPAAGGPEIGDTIKIGVHAPLTGAAPIPSTSFEVGSAQYWEKRGQIAGRNVEVFFADDKYNPASASQVCSQLIQRDQVDILVGSGGTDQIAACARIAAQANIPYLSAGVTENPLNRLANYFAVSKSYAQQAPLLVQWITKNARPDNNKIAVIRTDTPNFDDGINAFNTAAQQAGYEVVPFLLAKDPTPQQLAQVGAALQQQSLKVAFPLMAPLDWLEIVRQPGAVGVYWTGVGVTMGLNTVANIACKSPQFRGAFFSPWPALSSAGAVDPTFDTATRGQDDIVWSFWGLNKTIDQAFKKMEQSGGPFSRAAFAQAMIGGIDSGVYPKLNHTAQNHFGAETVNVLRSDCGNNAWKTQDDERFVPGF